MDTLRATAATRSSPCTLPDPAAREARMHEMADRWAHEFDPNALVTLRKRDGALQRRAAPLEDPRARALRHLALRRALPALDRPRRHAETLEGGGRRHLRRDRHRLRPPRRERRRSEVGPGPHGLPRPSRPLTRRVARGDPDPAPDGAHGGGEPRAGRHRAHARVRDDGRDQLRAQRALHAGRLRRA